MVRCSSVDSHCMVVDCIMQEMRFMRAFMHFSIVLQINEDATLKLSLTHFHAIHLVINYSTPCRLFVVHYLIQSCQNEKKSPKCLRLRIERSQVSGFSSKRKWRDRFLSLSEP